MRPAALRAQSARQQTLTSAGFAAAFRRWGSTVLFQFEDFGNENGRRLLDTYRGETCAFNDDIQGTAAAMLGGILAAMPLLKGGLGDQTFLFAGAGETGTGMADLLAHAISKVTRQPLTEARKRVWLFDSKGLVTRERAVDLEVRALCAGSVWLLWKRASDAPTNANNEGPQAAVGARGALRLRGPALRGQRAQAQLPGAHAALFVLCPSVSFPAGTDETLHFRLAFGGTRFRTTTPAR